MDDFEKCLFRSIAAFMVFFVIALVTNNYIRNQFYHNCVSQINDIPASEIHLICRKHE